ncbi:MAG: hypothetical protein V8T87_02205 [Victivallales bacterium]
MAIQKFTVSNDPDIYEAWPDVVLANRKRWSVFSANARTTAIAPIHGSCSRNPRIADAHGRRNTR